MKAFKELRTSVADALFVLAFEEDINESVRDNRIISSNAAASEMSARRGKNLYKNN
jgi:hypothetical protein